MTSERTADRQSRREILELYDQRAELRSAAPVRRILVLGDVACLFPLRMIREQGAWRWDTAAGREEILHRRISENELETIAVFRVGGKDLDGRTA